MSITDTELRDRLAQPAADVAATAPAAAPGHPDVDELIAYHQGELAPERNESVQDHLVACRECTESLLELDAFVQPGSGSAPARAEPSPVAAVESFETAAAWRALKRARSSYAPPRWPMRLAASLLVAAVGLGLVALERHRELIDLRRAGEGPDGRTNTQLLTLVAEDSQRGGSGGAEVSASAAENGMILRLRGASEGAEYDVAVRDQDGAVVWSGVGLRSDSVGVATLSLEGLSPGSYLIVLSGGAEEGEPGLGYRLIVGEP